MDRSQAELAFSAGVYVTDNVTLWRILDLDEKRKGMVPLEDCRFPDAPEMWRSVDWLMQHKARVVRQRKR